MNAPQSLSVDAALAKAREWLGNDPAAAEALAVRVLAAVPGHPLARLIQGTARRVRGETAAALEVLEPLSREHDEVGPVWLEYGIALGDAGRAEPAVVALKRAAMRMPGSPDAWRYLADQLDLVGEARAADEARARYLQAANRDPSLAAAAAALVANDLPAADARLLAHLHTHPKDVAALRMRAEVAGRLRRYGDAQRLLEQCLELAPSFDAARHNYAVVLNRQGKAAQALPHVERLLASDPRNPGYRNMKAAVLAHLGEYDAAISAYQAVLADYPQQPKVWMSYGHALKTAGRQADAIEAYRHGILLEPSLGEAYWSLANLKTFRFSAADVETMQATLQDPLLSAEDRVHFEFALGKAFEDGGEYAPAFAHYQAGNDLHRASFPYDADENSAHVARSRTLFTAQFLDERAGQGCAAADPIFIVGLPRAGSTLLEQILASHPLVEGTSELPDIPQLVVDLIAQRDHGAAEESGVGPLERAIRDLSAAQLRELGERYLAQTRAQRKTARPFFIDKMPNNWLYAGLIALILPNAKIIDARRHPMACGFSAFKQHFARGQSFSYSLADIGRYYRDYVDLMAHFDAVLPGRMHCVHYEAMVEDTESEVHRLLRYCGLEFDERCLRFYENGRAVRTASSEQVRRPIFREGMDHWRRFEPWLGPLAEALGPVLASYPALPHNV